MKMQVIYGLCFVALSSGSFSQVAMQSQQVDRHCALYPKQVDSVYAYVWKGSTANWELSTIWQYQSSVGRHDALLFINAIDRSPKQNWEYVHDGRGNRIFEVSKVWWNNKWDLYLKRESEYDSSDKKTNQIISFWKNGGWVLTTNISFEYIEDKLYRTYTRKWDQNGLLYDLSFSESKYEHEKLTEVREYKMPDLTLTRVSKYTYNTNGHLEELLILNPVEGEVSENNFVPAQLHRYTYDEYNLLRELISHDWNGSDWISANRFKYHYSLDKAKKVAICHNGQTICVSINALKAHLNHGDKLGKCSVTEQNEKKNWNTNSDAQSRFPFIIYPNPVKHSFTIKYDGDNSICINRIDILDSNGKIVKTTKTSEIEGIIIDRGSLKAGRYYIRLSGEESFMSTIIFN
jgi:hypothetical protein